MNDRKLREELDRVGRRYRGVLLSGAWATCWLALALAGLAVLLWSRGTSRAVPGALLVAMLAIPALLLPMLLAWRRRIDSSAWIARRVERQYPDLDARLLAALEQRPPEGATELGFLQQVVIGETVDHARKHRWEEIVPLSRVRMVKAAQWAMLLLFALVLFGVIRDMQKRPTSRSNWWAGGPTTRPVPFDIKVEPEDTAVERNTGLLVLARFGQERLPGEVKLIYKDTEGQTKQVQMSKSLDDPLFAGRIQSIPRDTEYQVQYGDEQTRWFKVGVFDYPELKQADANLKFPEYTGMEEKLVEDTRSVTAVEGTKATLKFKLNKPVAEARLVPAGKDKAAPAGPALELKPDPSDPSVYTALLDLKQSQKYELQLVDGDRRANKERTELAVNVTPNKAPDLKVEFPSKDVDVSPIEEMTVRAKVYDDFGVKRMGMSYSIGGGEPKDVILAENLAGKDRRDVANVIQLERLAAQPDQLVSYHLWAEDVGPDGKPRRTAGDMFFAEVRPFEEIFRQGEQPAGGEEEQQQQQQQAGQNAQQAEQLAEAQKQIINATWKVIRRETLEDKLSEPFVPDVKLIGESQAQNIEKAEALAERLTDARSKKLIESVVANMKRAVEQLTAAETGPAAAPLPGALSAEQAAYQDLLRLRAREHEVVRSNQRQQGQSQSSASARRQRQLDQLQMAEQDNRYETQRNAQEPQTQQQQEQRETRQVLNRLRELAQRQEDLNKQMKELQAALEKAKDDAQKEELQRQLARLRDQQQQQLRDTDELRDRMDRPENQERMADAKQQLDQTREQVRKASEALDKQQAPEAAAAGQRAAEQLGDLREQFRKAAAGQFDQAMEQIRADARELDDKQQDLSKKLEELQQGAGGASPRRPPQLRNGDDRQQLAQGLEDQKKKLEGLLENMKRTIEESETPEPVLSRQLYDAFRKTRQEQTDKDLDTSRQLLDRGLMDEARRSEQEATAGIARLRQDVERAAEGVLGGQTEALRRARNELDQLSQALNREMTRNGGPQFAGANPTTRPTGVAGGGNNPTTRPSGERMTLAQNNPNGQNPQQQQGQRGNPNRQGQQGQQGQQGERQPGQQGQQGDQQAQGRQGQQGQQDGQQQGQQGQRDGQQQGQQANAGQQGQQSQRQGQQGQGQQGEQQGQQANAGQQGEQQGQQPGQQGQQGQQGQGQQANAQGQQDQQGQQGQGQQGQGQQGQGQQGQGQQGQGQQGQGQQGQGQQGQGQQGQQANAQGQQGQQGQQGRGQQGQGQQGQQGEGQQPGQQQGQGQARGGTNRTGGNQDTLANDPENNDPTNPDQQGRQANAGQRQRPDLRLPTGQDRKRDPNRPDGNRNPDGGPETAPITGGGFREWSDRMRDVEEMVGDPRLRAEAARIRERVGEMRAEFKRHSKQPNWDVVNQTIGQPLAELRQAVSQELMKRESPEALVPIDRDAVPPEYADQVRRYYERLGSGK